MKARTFILTTCAAFVLVAPAAQAATSMNRLYEAKAQTTLFDNRAAFENTHHVTAAKTRPIVNKVLSPSYRGQVH